MIYEQPYAFIADNALLESNFFEEIDRWKTSNQNHSIRKFKSTTLTDEEYERMKSCIRIMKETDDFDEYRRAFSRFCYFCHIVPRGVIIKTYDLKKGEKANRNSLYVEYSYNTKKIELPEDITLYHMSKVEGITELNPYFRGKAVKGFLYDKPRIYFTIRRRMPKFLADYKFNEKLHMYICKEKIRYAYVDPLVWSPIQGAVYVESNKPIKVEELTSAKAKKMVEDENIKTESTEIDFDNFYNFVTENGFIIANE